MLFKIVIGIMFVTGFSYFFFKHVFEKAASLYDNCTEFIMNNTYFVLMHLIYLLSLDIIFVVFPIVFVLNL